MSIFHIVRNWMDFPLRNQVHWSRKGLQFVNESKEDMFADLPGPRRKQAEELEQRLRRIYRLTTYYHSSRKAHYQEAIYYLHMLESALDTAAPAFPDSLSAADIGASHWFYVQTLYALLSWYHTSEPRRVTLDGYEIDPYRPYADLYSRYDHACAHIDGLPGVQYHPDQFVAGSRAFDLVLMLFPFISRREHLRWGLPVNLFHPEALLAQAWKSVRRGGLLILANQGTEERDLQQELLKTAGLRPLETFPFGSPLYRYDLPRFVTVLRRG